MQSRILMTQTDHLERGTEKYFSHFVEKEMQWQMNYSVKYVAGIWPLDAIAVHQKKKYANYVMRSLTIRTYWKNMWIVVTSDSTRLIKKYTSDTAFTRSMLRIIMKGKSQGVIMINSSSHLMNVSDTQDNRTLRIHMEIQKRTPTRLRQLNVQ